jgi:hypothetical protein
MIVRWLLLGVAGLLAAAGAGGQPGDVPLPRIPWEPKGYVCLRAESPLHIDGVLEEAWDAAPWTEPFVDIEGSLQPRPHLQTRAKMLWDDTYFYVAAVLEQPHLWGTLTERDAVIYYDDDFEVFIDPDADTHEYYELEINALGTVWDLLLLKPYRDGAPAVDAWDIQGLKSAVFIDGTLNDPSDRDRGWSVELAIPWDVLAECAHRPAPPRDGDRWRVNFSRVEWRKQIHEGGYRKELDPHTGKPYPESNWVWSPQGLIAMHYPEMWGYVQFCTQTDPRRAPAFSIPADDREAYRLRQVYYKQKNHQSVHGGFATRLADLEPYAPEMPEWEALCRRLTLVGTARTYELSLECDRGATHYIRQDGRQWRSPVEPPSEESRR